MSEPTVEAVLAKARYLITPPEFWTKGAMRKFRLPQQRDGRPDQEFAFCALGAIDGAIEKLAPELRLYDRNSLFNLVSQRLMSSAEQQRHWSPGSDVVHKWNDRPNTTHEEVLAAFDDAIEKAEQALP